MKRAGLHRAAVPLVLLGLVLAGLAGGPRAAQAEEPPGPEKIAGDHAEQMARGTRLFDEAVRAILTQRCFRCHGGESTESELSLKDRESLLRGGAEGPAVVPGDASTSRLVALVRHEAEPKMPAEASQLPPEEIERLVEWINCGAPYSRPLGGTEPGGGWTERVVDESARQFWSFQPLAAVTVPPGDQGAWCRTPIDRFIRAGQQAAGLGPNPTADRRTLIRRLSFDLIGLPPTPDEVEQFVADPAPDAYERLVDRLLASPHYGERWGRHWLDLARFAESHGFEHDYDRPTAYTYRDFVIRALCDDLPFDTFLSWQLAGDELAPDEPLAWMATGFLAAGVHSTQITKNEVEKHRYDELDDMLATTTTTFLGLTVGCARCHDHKYDPFPQADYYRLLSTFTTTVRSEHEVNTDPQGYAQARAAFDAQHAPYEARVAEWEAQMLPERARAAAARYQSDRGAYPWTLVLPLEATAAGGAAFVREGDGSLKLEGANPDQETLTLLVRAPDEPVTALRIEALSDSALVKGGPGRADNGNFALSDLKLTVSSGEGADGVPVRLLPAAATFEQQGLPLAAAVDGDDQSAWAIDPEFGRDHAGVFRLENPTAIVPGASLKLTLSFKTNVRHGIGRLRLSLASAERPPDPQAAAVPPEVRAVLEQPEDARLPEGWAAIGQWAKRLEPEWRALRAAADEHLRQAPPVPLAKMLVSSEGLAAVRLHTQGEDFLPETHYLRRGDPNQKERPAEPGFLQILTKPSLSASHWFQPPPAGAPTSGRRSALARWLVDVDDGAGALTARVIVNRLWQHHLGRGLVSTPSDFGSRGERPSHPELLDWLARRLIHEGWRLKPLHRLIVTSAVYRQTADRDPAKLALDGENRWVWRYPARRLEAEVLRDSLLAISGRLDPARFGPGTLDPASRRRSIYFTVKRSQLVPMMQVFDAPDGLQGIAERPTTTIAPQALYLMNNEQVWQCAEAFARRIAPTAETPLEAAVRQGYRWAVGRDPSAEEAATSRAFVEAQVASYQAAGQAESRAWAWADFCQVLLSLNELAYVD